MSTGHIIIFVEMFSANVVSSEDTYFIFYPLRAVSSVPFPPRDGPITTTTFLSLRSISLILSLYYLIASEMHWVLSESLGVDSLPMCIDFLANSGNID